MRILFSLTFCSILFADFNQIYNGFGLDIGTSGSGIFVTRQAIHHSENYSLNAELRFYDIKASDETIVYNYYSGQYQTVGGKSLVMLPFLLGTNYYLFNGKIENNFSPFLTLRMGGVLVLDGDEEGSFKQRWSDPKIQLTPGGFIGAGMDFKMVGQTSVSVMIGLEILPYKEFDGSDNFTGRLIHISFNRRSK